MTDQLQPASARRDLARMLAETSRALQLARTQGIREVADRLRLRRKRSRQNRVYRAWVESYAESWRAESASDSLPHLRAPV